MLYQLSYASPTAPLRKAGTEPPGKPLRRDANFLADTLQLRAYHGTEHKVSIRGRGEQTEEKQGAAIREKGPEKRIPVRKNRT